MGTLNSSILREFESSAARLWTAGTPFLAGQAFNKRSL